MDNTIKAFHHDMASFETYKEGGESFLRLTTCVEAGDGSFYNLIISGLNLNTMSIDTEATYNGTLRETNVAIRFTTHYDIIVDQHYDAPPIDNIDGLEEMI